MGKFDLRAVVLEALAICLTLNFGSVIEQVFQGAVLFQKLHRAFVPDAGGARDVVGGVAHQGKQIGNLDGRHALELLHLGGGVQRVVLHHVQHRDALIHQLEHVLVRGDDADLNAFLGCFAGEGPNEIVGLITGVLEDGDTHGGEQPLDDWKLLDKFGRSFGAGGLVSGELLLAKGRPLGFEDRGQIVGTILLLKPPDHIVEDVGGFGRSAARVAHGRSATALAGVEGPEDEVEGVHQIEARHGFYDTPERAGSVRRVQAATMAGPSVAI